MESVKQVNADAIPGMGSVKEVKTYEVSVKNVLVPNKPSEDMTVKVIPFDKYDDAHVAYAYDYHDMMLRCPSAFRNLTDAARAYIETFVVHTREDSKNADSDYYKVWNDIRAARTLLNNEAFAIAIQDFFENA